MTYDTVRVEPCLSLIDITLINMVFYLILQMNNFIRLRTSEMKNRITLLSNFFTKCRSSVFIIAAPCIGGSDFKTWPEDKSWHFFSSFYFLVSPEKCLDKKSKAANSVSFHISLVSCTKSLSNFLTLYVPCITPQYVYKPTRCTKLLWLDFIFY